MTATATRSHLAPESVDLQLTDPERRAIRAQPEGVAYVAMLAVGGPRGRKYRPVRSQMWRTEEQGREALADFRRRFVGGRQLHLWSGVYLVDGTGEAVVVD